MFKGDHLFMKLMKIRPASRIIKSAYSRLPLSGQTEDYPMRGIPAITEEIIHEEDFCGLIDRLVRKLKKEGSGPLWYEDMDGEAVVIYRGSEKSILRAIEAEKKKREAEGVLTY